MSDDRLFASNNPIGRKPYFINLITLITIIAVTRWVFSKHIFPFVTSDVYMLIAKCIAVFLYITYAITLFALVDRRIYDISGTRDSALYKNISGFFALSIIVIGIVCLIEFRHIKTTIPQDMLYMAGSYALYLFGFIIFAITFIKGKFSNLSYDEYKKKRKYE